MKSTTMVLIAATLLVEVPTMGAEQSSKGDQPSVLFILADHLGIGDLGCYGIPILETPVIDSLARDEVRV